MTQRKVHEVFGTIGVFADGAAGGYTRAYGRCGAPAGSVVVEYVAPDAHHATVAAKTWVSPTRGDIRVLQGNAQDNTIDPGSISNRRRDHIYAAAGDDTITYLNTDGYRDIVRCGPGQDTVTLVAGRESIDRLIGCESIQIYGE